VYSKRGKVLMQHSTDVANPPSTCLKDMQYQFNFLVLCRQTCCHETTITAVDDAQHHISKFCWPTARLLGLLLTQHNTCVSHAEVSSILILELKPCLTQSGKKSLYFVGLFLTGVDTHTVGTQIG
jgi:hypothetical protein